MKCTAETLTPEWKRLTGKTVLIKCVAVISVKRPSFNKPTTHFLLNML